MQALLELSSPSNTLAALQLFYDSMESHTHSLQSSGTPQDSYRSMLVPIILRKLSADMHRNITKAHGSDQWTLNELKDAILQVIQLLEVGAEYSSNSHNNLHTPTTSFITGTEQRPQRTNTEHQKSSTCVYCG